KGLKNYFTKGELALWLGSVALIVIAFCFFDRESYMTLFASLIGVTSLIFAAKGNPLAQGLMIVFSLLYGYISFTFTYYGEMITYLGMTMPMAVVALITWLRYPYNGNRAEVQVNRIGKKEVAVMLLLTAVVTVCFHFILEAFDTANLLPSTLSVTTSFVAVYLTFRRSPYYAVAYAANDMVLIVLWVLATMKDIHYVSVVVCFGVFFVNDLYGFVSWKRMERRQRE
ncbi:MAG: nicotinamide riboside transporter PnuC, partial [Lachnospiraceae bacterium]